MSEFKGTPGPWVYSPERDTHDSIIHTADAVEKHGYIGYDNGCVVGSSEWIWIKEEDAHLIAAAPDLLEALEDALMHEGMGWELPIERMQAAIAKALGQ